MPAYCHTGVLQVRMDVFNSGLRSSGFILKMFGNDSNDHKTWYEPYTRLGPRSRMSERLEGCGLVSCSRPCPQLVRPWVRASLPPCFGCKAEQREGVSAASKIPLCNLFLLEVFLTVQPASP